MGKKTGIQCFKRHVGRRVDIGWMALNKKSWTTTCLKVPFGYKRSLRCSDNSLKTKKSAVQHIYFYRNQKKTACHWGWEIRHSVFGICECDRDVLAEQQNWFQPMCSLSLLAQSNELPQQASHITCVHNIARSHHVVLLSKSKARQISAMRVSECLDVFSNPLRLETLWLLLYFRVLLVSTTAME